MVGEILKVHKSLYKDYGEDVLRNYVLYVYLKWMSLGLRTLKSYKSSQLQKRFKKEKKHKQNNADCSCYSFETLSGSPSSLLTSSFVKVALASVLLTALIGWRREF